MASVHESLYFNPMMTNGVVHANVFGIKDCVTPYKMALLVLLSELGRAGAQLSLLERRRLNRLLLPLLQGPDMMLSRLHKAIEESCPNLANSVQIRIKLMAEGELKDMEQFFDDLSDSFTGTEPEVHKTSVVGLFLRHMILAYNKLSFSQVYKLYTALQQYYQNDEKKNGIDETDMELTNTEELEGKMEKEELDVPLREEEISCSGPLSQKQAEYFLSQQASLLKNDETKALTPAFLQKELNNLLKFNPDFAEASWLYILEQKRSDSCVLLEHSVKKAVHFGLPYLASLGIQSLVQQRAFAGKTANKLMDALKDSDLLHWKHSLSELIDISIAQKTAIWRLYGRSTMALQQAQMLLSMNSLEAVNVGVQQNNTESFAVVLCHLAELHAEQGCFAAASEILKHLKERFPPSSQHAQLWMLFDQKIQFDRAMNDGKYHVADSFVAGITALNSIEGVYRKAIVLKAQNQMSEAHKLLQKLLIHCQNIKNTEMVISVLLSIAELYWKSSCHTIALPVLLQALALSREYRLQYLASETVLNLAFSQLILGIPEQALNILHTAIEPILAHGAVLDKGCAMFLVAKCQVASAASYSQPKKAEALESAILNLNEAKTYFAKVDCKEQLRDVLYFQARLFHTLGKIQERNKCAMLFRQVHQELPAHGVPLINAFK
ncbi:anaphase-promoting complex subunit 5 isoform X3 [Gopherus flavomarginatus]|uniref:anaphase-promoting complex subunit 5 isoform X3 n=1 Tax=Gopherus flavomarginatus TaxID=286002 RepID=UPI0021CC0B97|nr:anaphase-promoting complex subunit 5 isoform X3 [Gopherus flavomarginatus]